MADLNLALVVSALDRATRPLQRIGASVSQLGQRARNTGRALRGLGGQSLTRVTLPLGALGAAAGRAFGQIEQMEVAFGSMTGSAERGRQVVRDLVDFAASTPFQLPGIGDATRQLLAAGVQAGDVTGELQVLGDIAAGAQAPIGDLAQIYAKSMSKGKVQTEELNQLSERGIPILDALVALAADYGNEISKQDVYKAAEQGKINFGTLREAMGKLTEDGAIFNEQMEKQSQTLFGLGSTLKDNVFLGLASVGQKLVEITNLKDRMKIWIATIQKATAWFNAFAEERPGLTKLIFGLTAATTVLGPALLALGVIVGGVGAGLTVMGAALGFLASPIILAGAAIAGAALLVRRNWDGVVGFFRRVWEGVRNVFPGAAAFFEGLWSKVATPVAGIFDWLKAAWDDTIVYLSGPREGESLYDWLMRPVGGLFQWLRDAWDRAMAWIRRPQVDIWDGVIAAGAGAAAAAQTILDQVRSAFGALDWTEIGSTAGALLVSGIVTLTGLLSRMTAAVEGLDFAGVGIAIGATVAAAVVSRISTLTGLVDGLLDRVREIDFVSVGSVIGAAVWTAAKAAIVGLSGLYQGLADGVRKIDFSKIGEVIGKAIQTAVIGVINLARGLVEATRAASQDGALAEAAGDIGRAILDGIVAVITGLGEVIVGIVKGAFDGIDWMGFVPEWARNWLDGSAGPDGPAALPGGSNSGAAPEPSLFAGPLAAQTAPVQVGGEMLVRFENAPPGTSVEKIRRDGDVDLTADLGYAMDGG